MCERLWSYSKAFNLTGIPRVLFHVIRSGNRIDVGHMIYLFSEPVRCWSCDNFIWLPTGHVRFSFFRSVCSSCENFARFAIRHVRKCRSCIFAYQLKVMYISILKRLLMWTCFVVWPQLGQIVGATRDGSGLFLSIVSVTFRDDYVTFREKFVAILRYCGCGWGSLYVTSSLHMYIWPAVHTRSLKLQRIEKYTCVFCKIRPANQIAVDHFRIRPIRDRSIENFSRYSISCSVLLSFKNCCRWVGVVMWQTKVTQ